MRDIYIYISIQFRDFSYRLVSFFRRRLLENFFCKLFSYIFMFFFFFYVVSTKRKTNKRKRMKQRHRVQISPTYMFFYECKSTYTRARARTRIGCCEKIYETRIERVRANVMSAIKKKKE